jgi:hypothetical protein
MAIVKITENSTFNTENQMNKFIPDVINSYDINKIIDLLLRIGLIDYEINGQCLNSPYYVKYNGKLYKGEVRSHSPTGIKLTNLKLGIIRHVPMSEVE